MIDTHEFHVWALSSTEKAMMIHLETKGTDDGYVYKRAIEICQDYSMRFYTIQIENTQGACPLKEETEFVLTEEGLV